MSQKKKDKAEKKVRDKYENDPRFLVKSAEGKGLSEETKLLIEARNK